MKKQRSNNKFLKIAAVVPLLKQQGLLDLFAGG